MGIGNSVTDLDATLDALTAENHELQEEAGGLRRFMDSLAALVDALDSPTSESEALGLLADVLDTLVRAVGVRDGSLLAPTESGNELVFVLVRGEQPNPELIGRRLSTGVGIAGWVAQNRRATIVNNARIDDRFYSEVDVELDYRTASLLAAPLIGGDRLLGVVEVLNKHDNKLFTMGNQTLLTLMCRFAGELLYSTIKDIDLTQTNLRPANLRSARPAASPDQGDSKK